MSAPHDRAKKLAAHAKCDTNEGRIARSLLERLISEHPELASHLSEAPPKPSKKPKASSDGSLRSAPEEPERRESIAFASAGERRLLVVLSQAHGLYCRYEGGMYSDDPHRFDVRGPRTTVAEFMGEYQSHRATLEAIQDAVSEAYQRAAFPNAPPVTLSSTDAEYHVFGAASDDQDGWMRKARDRERRLRHARSKMPEPDTTAASDRLVRVAIPAGFPGP